MRYVSSATLVALSILAPAAAFGQLTITNYQLVSQQMVSLTTTNYTYTAQVANTGAALASVTATATSLTPSTARFVPGLNALTFGPVATNGQVTSTNTFTIQVNRAVTPVFTWADLQWSFQSTPAAPVANAGPNQPATVNQTITLNGSGSTNPSGVGSLTYLWAFTSRPPGSSTILLNQTSVHPQFIVDVGGNYVIKLTVSNGVGSSSSTVTVSTTDTAPVANAGPNQTVAVGATVTLNGSGSTDANSDPLTFQWTILTVPSGSTATLAGATTVSPTFVADKAGSYVIQLVVNDGLLNGTPATVTITTGNTAPVANAGPNQMVNLEATVQLDGSGSTDVDSNPLTYSWSFLSIPTNSTAILSSTSAVKPTFVADLPGTYIAQLIVHDGVLVSTPSTVTVTTNPPLAPTANAGPAQVIPHFNTTVQLSGSGTDPQGLQLTYLWSFTSKPNSSAATLTGATTATPTFFADLPGTYTVQLIVNDGYLNSVPATVMITTDAAAPTANPGTAQSLPVGTTATLNGSGSVDLNGESLIYTWSFNSKPNGSTATLTGANTVAPTFVPDVAGLYVVQLIVSDGFASSSPATVNITATQTPASISVTSGSPQSASTNTAFAAPLVVTVLDATSHPVPNVIVTFAAPASGAGGTFAGGVTTATTNASGVATSAVFSANGTVGGPYTVAATVSGVATAANFALTNNQAPAASITTTSGSPQSAQINTAFAAPLVATVLDATSNPVSNVVVTFLAPTTGVSGTFAGGVNTATTNASGVATSAVFTANGTVGAQYTVTATVSGVATPAAFLLSNTAGAAASITATSGTPQTATAGTAFAAPLVVTVKDAGSNPVPNVVVTFAAPSTGPSGTFASNATTATTNASGVATSAVFTANTTAGAQYTVTASVSGVATPANFLFTNTAGIPASITATSGTPQTATVGTAFGAALAATVKDSNGNPVGSGIVVTFAAPASGPSGTFALGATTAATNASGVATSAIFTANTTAGAQYTVSASVSGAANPASFLLTNNPGSAASILVTSGSGQTAADTTAFAAPLVATVKDANGNPVASGVAVTFTAPVQTGASGTFTGGLTTATVNTNASGVATSPTFTANGNLGTYTVPATVSGASTPANFSLTNLVGAAASVTATSGGGQTTGINTAFANTLVAVVKDAGGNPVSNVVVTFAAPGSGASGTFANGATTATTNASGTATSAIFTANATGGTYNVSATAPGVATAATYSLTNNATGIILQTGVSVNVGSQANLTVTLPTAAPAGGTLITLASSNSNFVSLQTTTFLVSPGNFTPSITPKVTGVGFGTVTITATATGYTAGTTTVTAADTLSFSGNPMSITGPVVGQAFLNLSATAPTGGIVVNLSSSNPAVATVPSTVTIAANTTSVNVPVTGVSGGTTVITASSAANNIPATTLNVTVVALQITTTTLNTGLVGVPYSQSLTAINGTTPYTWTLTTGTLPTGMTFTNGVLGGTPSVTTPQGGTSLSFRVVDSSTSPQQSATATLTLTVVVGTPATITATTGTGQSTADTTAFSLPLSVTVKDVNGYLVPNQTVTFTAPTTGASGTFAGAGTTATATTNSSGIATSPVFTANSTDGSYQVNATVSPVATPAVFSLTNNVGAASTITVTSGSGQSATEGTAFANPLVVTVKDAGGNPVSGATVTFTVPGTNASGTFTTSNTATTTASGVATSNVFTANGTAGAYSVTAASGAATGASFSLTNNVGAPASVTVLSGSGQTAAANGAFTNPLVATVKDSGGNVLTGQSVTFSAPAQTNPSVTFTTANPATTNVSGNASVSVTANAHASSAAYNVTATVTGSSITPASFSLTNVTGSAASIVTTSGSGQTAADDTAFTAPLVATVKDSGGNPVSGATVNFTVTPVGGASLTFTGGASATTDVNGNATKSVTANGTVGGAYTVTATIASTSLSTTFSLTNVVGAATTIAVNSGSGQSAAISTNFGSALVVKATDAGGNAVSGVVVTFTAPSSGASGTFAVPGGTNTTTATTNASGLATASTYTANATAGGPYNVTATATGLTAVTFSMTNNPGAPASIAVNGGNSQGAAVGTAFTTPLSVVVKDSGGNLLSGVGVTFQAPSSGASATFAGGVTTATTLANGVATSAIFTANSTIGQYPVSAFVTATPSVTTSFTLNNNSGPPASITATGGNSQSATVGTAYAQALQVTVKDASNNPVAGITVTFTVPALPNAGGTFAGGVTTAVTSALGVANSPVLTANTKAGAVQVTASIASPSLSTTFSLTNNAGAAAAITATSGFGQSVAINTNFANPLVATVTDSSGNPITGASVTFTAPLQTLASATFGTSPAITVAAGTATTSVRSNSVANSSSYNVTATITGTSISTTFALTNNVGPAQNIAISSGNNQSAGILTAYTNPLAVTVTDAGGNLVPNAVVTFTTPLQTVASGTFASGITTATTTASGVATSGVFTANAIKGTVAVGASSGSATLATPFSLTNTAGLPAAITVTSGSPQSAQIGAAFAPLSVTVKDSQGNTVNSGVIVTFTPPGAGLASGTFAGGVNTAATNASGVATSLVFTANSTVGGPYNVAVTATTGNAPAVNFSLQNLPGNPAAITATGGTPQSATVGAAFATSFSATVKDSGGNVVPNATVTFTVQPNGGATGSFTGPLTTTTALTSAAGVATTSLAFTAGTVSGSYSVVATVSGVGTGATFALTNNAGAPASITMTSGSGQSAQLQAAFTNPLVATVKDTNGNFVSGATVTFTAPASPNASGTFFGATNTVQVQTIANGTATSPVFTANTVVGGPYNVAATVTGVGTGASFSLQNLPGAPSSITVTSGSAQTAAINTAFGQQFSVTIKDAGGNLVPNAVVTFTAPPQAGASGTFAGGVNTVTTSGSGVATSAVFTANSHASTSTYNVVVSVSPGSAPTQNISLTNLPGQATTVTATSGTPQSVKISTAFAPLVATVTDASGNPVLAGVSVTFVAPTQTLASGLFGGALSTTLSTNASGQVSATLTANSKTGGPFSVTASVAGATTQATYSLTNTAGNPTTVTITSGNNQAATVNTQFGAALVVTVTDSGSNPVPNTPVLFTAPTPGTGVVGGTFGGLTTTTVNTNTQGVATSPAFTANTSASFGGSTYSVTAAATAGTGSASFSLTNNAGAPASIAMYSGSPQTAYINEQFSNPLQAIVKDSFMNVVTGAKVTFTPPPSGASANFAAGVNTALTNNGVAVSSLLSANNLVGPYTVSASVAGVSGTASFSLTNSIVGSSSGTLTLSQVSGGSLTVGQNMQIIVQANLSVAYSCSSGQSGLNINVGVDGVNLLVGSGASGTSTSTEVVQIPCGGTAVDFYVGGGATTGAFPVTLEAPGYTTGSGTVTVAPSGFVLSADGTLPPSTTMSTFTTSQGVTTPLYIYAVQLNSSLNYVTTGTIRNGFTASIPVTVLNPSFGTVTTPVTISAGSNAGSTSFTAGPSATGTTNITLGSVTGFSQPSANSSVVVTVQASSIIVPNATVGINLETPVQLTLNGVAQGTCGAGTEPFTVQSSSPNLLLSNSSTGQGVGSITVPINSCGSTSNYFYLQVVGGIAGQTVTYTASGAGFAMGTGTVTIANSGFVIAEGGNNPGSVPYFLSVAGAVNNQTTLTVYSYQLDQFLNPVSPQSIAPGGTVNAVSVTVPVNVDNTTYGTVTPTTIVIPAGSLSGQTYFLGLVGGNGAVNANIANVSVAPPASPTGFSTPASDVSIPAHVINPSFSISDSRSVGLNLQGYGSVSVGTVQTSPLTVQVAVISNTSALLLSATGTDAGSGTINLVIPAGSSITPSYSIYGLAAGGTATYQVSAAGFTPQTSTITLTPSGIALSGNFSEGGQPYLETSTTSGLASGTYTSGITATGTVGQTCTLSTFNGGSNAFATVTLTGTNTIASGSTLTGIVAGSGFASAPTSATATSGTATCSGTAVVSTSLVGPPSFTVEVGQLASDGVTWEGEQALIPTVSVVVNLATTAPGTLTPSQVTIPGGLGQVTVGFVPTTDGVGQISVSSATNVSAATSTQSTMQVAIQH